MSQTIDFSQVENAVFNVNGGLKEVSKIVLNNNTVWEKITTPKIMLMPMYGSGSPVYHQNYSGTATEGTTYYEFDPAIGDFSPVSIATGDSIIGYYIKRTSEPEYYMVWRDYKINSNLFGLKEIRIPSKYKGLPVLGIIPFAFQNDTNITKVIIENGIEFIGYAVFSGCSNLESISLPSTLTTFYSNMLAGTAIYNNASNWINDVFTLNNRQIRARSSVTTANIGENIIGIAQECYSACELTDINLNSNVILQRNNKDYVNAATVVANDTGSYSQVSAEGIIESGGYFSNGNDNEYYPTTNLHIGENVTTLPTNILLSGSIYTPQGSSAGSFTHGGIKPTPSMLVNTPITHLATYCMLYKTSNTGLMMTTSPEDPFIIPKRITQIDPYALAGGSSFCAIEYVRIECDVLSKGMFAAVRPSNGGTSPLYSLLKGVEFTGNPPEIPDECFFGCNTLLEINIPASVRKIGAKSFQPGASPSWTNIIFNQPSGVEVEFAPAGGSGAFYYKLARAVNVYTDNESVKNYDWASDNVTATFYHLDGTAWE